MKYSSLKISEVLKYLKTRDIGLSNEEARKRLSIYGKNKLDEQKKESFIIKFLSQFKDLMIVVLIIASIFSFFLSYINNESYIDSLVIIAIVVLNAVLGFIQELKADKSIDELRKCK